MKYRTIILIGICAAYVGWRFGTPFVDTKPEQDACTFGTVSNQRYRELLTEAQHRARTTWAPLQGTAIEKAAQLRSRTTEMSVTESSIFDKIAIMHAVMRAEGAYLEGMLKLSNGEPYGVVENSTDLAHPFGIDGVIGFGYYIHSNSIGEFDVVDPYSAVTFRMPLDRMAAENLSGTIGNFHVSINSANLFGRLFRVGLSTGVHSRLIVMTCPQMPDDRWVNTYNDTLSRRKMEDQK